MLMLYSLHIDKTKDYSLLFVCLGEVTLASTVFNFRLGNLVCTALFGGEYLILDNDLFKPSSVPWTLLITLYSIE